MRDLFLTPWFEFFEDVEGWTKMCNVHDPMDIYETKDGLHIEVAVTGAKKEEINVEVKNGDMLIISRENEKNEVEEERNYIINKIRKGNFNTKLQITPKFNLETITQN